MQIYSNKTDSYDNKTLFRRAIRLSWLIFFLSFLFLAAWVLGFSREHIMVPNTNSFSQFFFFLNPHIFNKIFIEGNILAFLQGASTPDSFVFIWAYLFAFLSFVSLFFSCMWLFLISYKTSIKTFHCISCLGIFPVIGGFLILWFIVKMVIYQIEMKRLFRSRFENSFLPEEFVDPTLQGLNEENLNERKITTNFTKAHYDRFYSKKKKDFLRDLYDKLKKELS